MRERRPSNLWKGSQGLENQPGESLTSAAGEPKDDNTIKAARVASDLYLRPDHLQEQ